MKKELFRFINKTIQFAENKYTLKFLAIISFLESIIFPIPPDIFLIPISMTKKYRWFFLGIYTTFFSILGGIFGYLIGAFFWDYIGEKIVFLYNAEEKLLYLKELFNDHGWAIILIAGLTPLPYKFFTIASGLFSLNFFVFLICSFLSRALRFLSVTYLVSKYGQKGIELLNKHFLKFSVIILIVIITIIYVMLNG